jgi:3-dehydro-L-gulonate 2-dehydrogenase
MSNTINISAEIMHAKFREKLLKHGVSEERSDIMATIFTESTIDGVYTHGVNRFPRFIDFIHKGCMDIHAEPQLVKKTHAIEQWDGHHGAGIINALKATDRAIALAKEFGIGCVALRNTNHWMRAGTYGWRAARAGCIMICTTNTTTNMPAWGSTEKKLGNNPLVIAIPHEEEAIVLDMAMAQYSYGSLELADLKGETMRTLAGYDTSGNLTDIPGEVLKTERTLPMGFWKGAGLSFMLDLLVALLSDGKAVSDISKHAIEYDLSQIFITIDPSKFDVMDHMYSHINEIIATYKNSVDTEGRPLVYPGERVVSTRAHNKAHGIEVLNSVWDQILAL